MGILGSWMSTREEDFGADSIGSTRLWGQMISFTPYYQEEIGERHYKNKILKLLWVEHVIFYFVKKLTEWLAEIVFTWCVYCSKVLSETREFFFLFKNHPKFTFARYIGLWFWGLLFWIQLLHRLQTDSVVTRLFI